MNPFKAIRNTLAISVLAGSVYSMTLPYWHVYGVMGLRKPLYEPLGYELYTTYAAVAGIGLTIGLLFTMRRKWSPIIVLASAFMNIAALMVVRFEGRQYFFRGKQLDSEAGDGFLLLLLCTLVLLVICGANLMKILAYQPTVAPNPELIDESV